ncbi:MULTISPECIES: hypothetical protein [unclassified Acinetobacter]|uniref:hypothetical protein n=1 Tax=unclassified Acinetobacter TaxID=196816 RepID=UPI001022E75C|nr:MULTISPECIES: hypothetical protein [unclassified Acinetobacter]RZG76625.1 hypothetical protein EXE09_06220 [Acinetobacter sp. WCHAc060025]RZG77065.1 hypothetical protein EXE10_19445 [Acinetobacter sp. WCHAc060033]
MDVQDFYIVAKNLHDANTEENEAINRTVVGRTYYAVYLATRDWIDQRFPDEIDEAEGNSHEKYTSCLLALQRTHMDLTLSRFSRELKTLKAQRHFADYSINKNDQQTYISTQAALLQGKKLLDDLDILKQKYP